MQADEENVHYNIEDEDVSESTSFLRKKPDGEENIRASLRYSLIDVNDQLSYSWQELEVFGVLPVEGNIISRCCKKQKSVDKKHLLKKVTGIARSGELLAVMGSSGAGKTTLLNALAFRTPPGIKVASSSIRALNGVPVDSETLRSRCGYIQQDDLFIGNLTTREHLVFQALLRMGRTVPRMQKMFKVDEVISELSLSKCENTLIGVPGRDKGLSGGEKKRLAFATEALTNPNLLLCDEPTSGLDSYMAASVIKVLKKLARKGKTIVCTIHQPSSETFNLFDKLLLMSEGRTAFLGTINEANDFFTSLGTPCPKNFNPADFFVQILAIAPGREVECRAAVNSVSDAFALTEIAETIREDASIKENDIVCKVSQSDVRAGWWTQFYVILWRSWVSVLKEPVLVKVRLFQTIMIALLIGVIFYGQKMDQDGIMNINGAIFLFLTNMTFDNVFAVMNVFSSELPIFMLEKRARLYGADVYFLGKTLSQLPLFLILPVIFTGICYPMIGLTWTIPHFACACLIVTLVANVATSFGYMISCASPSISVAMSLGAPIIAPFLIFGGYYLNAASVPKYLVWLSYFSWFKYGNEALVVNQWLDVTEIHCSNKTETTCYSNGKMVLTKLNFEEENFYWDIGALVGLFLLFRLIAYIALALRSRGNG